jgi:hypothetical protein
LGEQEAQIKELSNEVSWKELENDSLQMQIKAS